MSLMVFRTDGPCTDEHCYSSDGGNRHTEEDKEEEEASFLCPVGKIHSLPLTFTEHEPSDGSGPRRDTTRLRFTQALQRPEPGGRG